MRIQLLVLPTVLAATLVLSGCQALAPGPLAIGGDEGQLCVPVSTARTVLVGDVVGAPSGGDITITNVELVDADGVSISDAWLLPFTADEPPVLSWTEDPSLLSLWPEREQIDNVSVAAGTELNLVVELTLGDEKAASATGIAVTYLCDTREFRKLNSTSLIVTDENC